MVTGNWEPLQILEQGDGNEKTGISRWVNLAV